MGIFSDKCSNCGNKVKKQAKFCNHCGTPAPKGWWRCYACNEFVGNDSLHCWNCNATFQVASRSDLKNGLWQKDISLFAQVFEIRDLKSVLENGIEIPNGIKAAVASSENILQTYNAGKYSIAEHLENAIDQNLRLILFDAGDVSLPIHIKGLSSSEGHSVDLYSEITLSLKEENLSSFLTRTLKTSERISYEEISHILTENIRPILEAFSSEATISDLVSDAQGRIKLEKMAKLELSNFSERTGFDLVYISSAEFYGEVYEEFLKENAQIDLQRRDSERQLKLKELLSSDKMKEFKTEAELDHYQEQLAHEFNLKKEEMERERSILLEAWSKKDELASLSHEFDKRLFSAEKDAIINKKLLQDEIELSSIRKEAEREDAVKDAANRSDVRKIDFEQEKEETEQAFKWREKKNSMKNQQKEDELLRRKNLSEIELLTDIDDDEKRKDLIEFMKLSKLSEMSIEEVLAMKSSESAAAADALARINESKKQSEE